MRASARMPSYTLAILVPALALGGPACGGDDGGTTDDTVVPADTLTADTLVDEDTETADTTVAEDTVAADTIPASCTANDACGPDLTCHQLDEVCVSDPRCLAEAQACDPEVAHPFAFLCVAEGAGDGQCQAACATQEECEGADAFCGPAPEDPKRARCQTSNCDGAWDVESCGAGNRCFLFPKGEDAWVWGCAPIAVEGQENDACEYTSECSEGLYCAPDGACREMACKPQSGEGCPQADGETALCVTTEIGQTADVGSCWASSCDPLGDPTGCEAGQLCQPLAVDAITGAVGGACAVRGDRAADAVCEAHTDCGDGLLCWGGRCTASRFCGDPAELPGGETCSADQICIGGFAGVDPVGLCIPRCGLFDDECGADGVCSPFFGEVRGADNHLEGGCQPATSALLLGERCFDFSECAPGLLCVDSRCAQLCDVSPELSGQGACGAGATCVTLEEQVGLCFADDCQLWAGGCETGEACVPHFFGEDHIIASCETSGGKAAGESCAGWGTADCVDGAVCLWESDTEAGCYTSCDPDAEDGATGACPTGERCFELGDGTVETGLGYCLDVCAPWTTGACPTGETCLPQDDGSFGVCIPTGGTKGVGEICATNTACQDGMVCAGTCQLICDPMGAPRSGGDVCETGETCVQYSTSTDPPEFVPFGGCYPGCTAGDPEDECGRNEVCIAKELYEGRRMTRDMCAANQPIETTCDATNLGALCADGFAACLDLEDGPACAPFCRESNGELLRVGHPDCADTDAVCDPLIVGTLGFCHSAGAE